MFRNSCETISCGKEIERCFIAISGSAVWEIRTTADAGNIGGGFFVTGASGSDFSQQNSPQYLNLAVTAAGAGNVIATASAAADMVGNGLYVVSGTNLRVGTWFEITSVVAGVSITLSTNGASQSIATGVSADGVVNIGGAISLGAANDDAVFEAMAIANNVWIKAGTYTLGGTVTIARASSAANPILVRGYNTTRGDNPKGTGVNSLARPIINTGANAFTSGSQWLWRYIEFTGTGASVFTPGTRSEMEHCKVTNTSTTDFRIAISTSVGCVIYSCEAISYRGYAVLSGGSSSTILDCYFHDSKYGVANNNASAPMHVIGCLFRNITVEAVRVAGSTTYKVFVLHNSFHNCNNTGTAINHPTGNAAAFVTGNNFSNFANGVVHADTTQGSHDEYNNYYDNTTDVTLWTKGDGDVAVNPGYAITDVTGTTATTSGSVLTDSGKDFTALGVVAGRDFINIISGTGVTVGIYGITVVGTTTLTLDIAPGTDATADKVYNISVGSNFAPSAGLRGVGTPGTFPAGYTIGYQDIGAVQARATGTAEAGLTIWGPTIKLG